MCERGLNLKRRLDFLESNLASGQAYGSQEQEVTVMPRIWINLLRFNDRTFRKEMAVREIHPLGNWKNMSLHRVQLYTILCPTVRESLCQIPLSPSAVYEIPPVIQGRTLSKSRTHCGVISIHLKKARNTH